MANLFRLMTGRPRLLADQAQADADLVAIEFAQASRDWKRQALLQLVILCGLAVGAVLAGVAVMLWAVIPADQLRATWVLVAVPLLPLAAAVACLLAARSRGASTAFNGVRSQIRADMAMLREAGAL